MSERKDTTSETIFGRRYDTVITLTRSDGNPLQTGDIQAGQYMEFDGLTGETNITPPQTQERDDETQIGSHGNTRGA